MNDLFNNQRKLKKFRLKGIKINNKILNSGLYGLVSLETGRLETKVIESFIHLLKRRIKLDGGKLWLMLNASIPVTKVPIGTRMGKGKGSFFKKVCFIKKGSIICEIRVSEKKKAFEILKSAASKLSVKTRVVFYF